jgi:hypothetical protein
MTIQELDLSGIRITYLNFYRMIITGNPSGMASKQQHMVKTTTSGGQTYYSQPHPMVTLSGNKASSSNFTVTTAANKDNVYIVTLPQHQVNGTVNTSMGSA